jgi:hypothetical protein
LTAADPLFPLSPKAGFIAVSSRHVVFLKIDTPWVLYREITARSFVSKSHFRDGIERGSMFERPL